MLRRAGLRRGSIGRDLRAPSRFRADLPPLFYGAPDWGASAQIADSWHGDLGLDRLFAASAQYCLPFLQQILSLMVVDIVI